MRILVALALVLLACAVPQARREAPSPAPPPPAILGLDGRPDPRPDAALAEVVRKECAACHVVPSPSDAPRAVWRQRLQEMKRFSLTRTGLTPGRQSALATLDLEPLAAYFEARAPQTLPFPEPWPAPEPGRFERRLLSPPRAVPVPIVASTQLFDLDGDGKLEQGKITHTTLDLGDVDGDGDVDLVTGNFVGFTFTKTDTGFKADVSVELWINQAKP